MDSDLLLPLFPLEIVLLPEEPLPLHIFEDRYKKMIGDCLKAKAAGRGQQEFGVVLLKGKSVSPVGCTAHIVNVTRQYEDGRMDILTVGKRRFEILLTNEELPYQRGAVEYFEDDGPNAPSDEAAELVISKAIRIGVFMTRLLLTRSGDLTNTFSQLRLNRRIVQVRGRSSVAISNLLCHDLNVRLQVPAMRVEQEGRP